MTSGSSEHRGQEAPRDDRAGPLRRQLLDEPVVGTRDRDRIGEQRAATTSEGSEISTSGGEVEEEPEADADHAR